VAITALALLLALPSLAVGFCTDDYDFRARVESTSRHAPASYDLFRFVRGAEPETHRMIEAGYLPWWSAPDLKLHFVRPLTSLAFALDDTVFGGHALGYHLHSIAWYLVLVALVGLLYRRLLDGATATLALLVFAWSHAHVLAYAWASARHILVGAVPAVLGLVLLVLACERGWRPGRWLAPLALAVGLAGSEAALGAVFFWLSYALLGPRPGAREGQGRSRLKDAAPALILAAVYLVLYRLVGGGARGSGGYHDPLSDPLGFLRLAVTRLPMLLGDALLGVRVELAHVWSEGPLALVGLVAAGIVGLLYLACRRVIPERERVALRWLVPGGIGAALLGVTGFPSGRVLLLPDVGFAALLGVLLHRGFVRQGAGSVLSAGLRVAGAGLLVLVHVVLAPLSSLHVIKKLTHEARRTEAIARRIGREAPASGRVFLVAASDPMVFLYPRGILAETSPEAVRCWSVLSAAKAGHRVTRTGERSLVIEPEGRTLLDGSFDTLFRASDRPFSVGETVEQCGATVRVSAVKDGRPSRVEVDFDTSLDAPELALLVWRDSSLQRFVPPAIGETVELPWSPGPSGVL
jgi:hypothetical protein